MNPQQSEPTRPVHTDRTAHDPRTGRSMRRVAGLAALPLVASLVLVGCSTGQSDAATSAGGSPGRDGAASSSTATSGGTAAGGADVAASNDALRAATETARKAVGSGTVISVEQEQRGSTYEVLVVTTDGTEHEVHTNQDGTSVAGTVRTETTDTDDRAEDERFVAAADLGVRDAADRFEDLHAGTITELGLDDHLGAVVWEGDVRDASGTKHSLRIDAGSGKVVTDRVDTDD